MLIAPLLLTAALVPAVQESAAAKETAGASQAAAEAAGSPASHIEAGLREFRKRRFARAQAHFEQALDADPQSAAATFYLGYTTYKIAEPKRPFHPDKQKAAELFAKAYSLDPAFKPAWRG